MSMEFVLQISGDYMPDEIVLEATNDDDAVKEAKDFIKKNRIDEDKCEIRWFRSSDGCSAKIGFDGNVYC